MSTTLDVPVTRPSLLERLSSLPLSPFWITMIAVVAIVMVIAWMIRADRARLRGQDREEDPVT